MARRHQRKPPEAPPRREAPPEFILADDLAEYWRLDAGGLAMCEAVP